MRRCPFQRTLRSNRPPRHPHPKGTLSKEPLFSAERARRSILRTWRRFPICRCPTGCCRCHQRQRFDRRPVSCRRCNSNKAGGATKSTPTGSNKCSVFSRIACILSPPFAPASNQIRKSAFQSRAGYNSASTKAALRGSGECRL